MLYLLITVGRTMIIDPIKNPMVDGLVQLQSIIPVEVVDKFIIFIEKVHQVMTHVLCWKFHHSPRMI